MTQIIIASQQLGSTIVDGMANKAKANQHDITLIEKPQALSQQLLERLAPRYIFFPFWSHLIGSDIHEQYECVMFHMTDLPYGRGGSPLQNLIARGHKHTQMSAFRCTDGMDAGPIYLKKPLSLEGKASDIYLRAARLIAEMIKDIVELQLEPRPQTGVPTYFKRRQPAESDISGIEDIDKAYDYIRMLDAPGYPNAYIETDHLVIEFCDAQKSGQQVNANVTIKAKRTDEDQ